jgi:hypothetical protein
MLLPFVLVLAGCADPEKDRLRETTIPTYDKETGKLTEVTFDSNKNGVVDTWTEMNGAKPVLTRMDLDEDGKIDRWEYFDADGKFVKLGFSRRNTGQPDAWAYTGATLDVIERIEISSTGDEKKIDRWERYGPGNVLVEADEDTNGDGRPDKWETYENGAVKTLALDLDGDGRPDQRLTYRGSALATIESEPDVSGRYTKIVKVD